MSKGVLAAIAAYMIWGFSVLYWKLLDDIGSGDVVAHRILATAIVLAVAHLVMRSWPRLRAELRKPRVRRVAAASAALLATNWVVFVWSVETEQVVQTSLGYFINPLLSVLLGVFILGERMRPVQWFAVGLAALGVVVLTIDLRAVPWIALVLAGTFAVYGLLRKTSPVGSLDGLSLEVGFMAPFALAVVLVRAMTGAGAVGASDPGRDLLLLGAGVVTAAPLLLFAVAARRVELSVVGLLQYIAPTIQFLLSVLVLGEEWNGGQVVGFVLIWLALAVFAAEGMAKSAKGTFPPAAAVDSS
ncbi:MAG: EamA family transporter RarD [Microthrixaceae bacterium]